MTSSGWSSAVCSSALRGIVGYDHAFAPPDPAYAGDDACGGGAGAVHAVGGELADLQERAARVQQAMNPVAGQQLAARHMAVAMLLGAAERGLRHPRPQLFGQRAVMCFIGAKALALAVDRGGDDSHAPISSRPISMRRISLVPAPMSSSLASRI